MTDEVATGFNNVYKRNLWRNNQGSLSGPGSSLKAATNIIVFLEKFIKEKNIKKIIDGSCGDCNWIMKLLSLFPDIEYVGNDISDEIIEKNKLKYGSNKKYTFYSKNILKDNIESCDLFIFRHTMQHLTQANNLIILDNMKRNCKYCLLTHHEVNTHKPDDSRVPIDPKFHGALKWSQINLHMEPFSIDKKHLVESVLESNNVDEYANIYLFNE